MDIIYVIFLIILLGAVSIASLWLRQSKLVTEHIEWMKQDAVTRSTVQGLKHELEWLRKGIREDVENEGTVWIVASMSGIVLDCGGGLIGLLRYRPAQLIGKNITTIIPPDEKVQKAHHDGLENVGRTGVIRTKAISGRALASNGTEVPVVVSLKLIEFKGESCVRAQLFELETEVTESVDSH